MIHDSSQPGFVVVCGNVSRYACNLITLTLSPCRLAVRKWISVISMMFSPNYMPQKNYMSYFLDIMKTNTMNHLIRYNHVVQMLSEQGPHCVARFPFNYTVYISVRTMALLGSFLFFNSWENLLHYCRLLTPTYSKIMCLIV